MTPRRGDQAGFTLIELMVAIGIGLFVTLIVSTLVIQTLGMQRQMNRAMEREDMRNIVRQKLRCDMPCAKVTEGLPRTFGKYAIDYECTSLTRGIRPMVRATTGSGPETIEHPLFELTDGYPCQGRMPANCVYGCHWNGEMVGNRGYLYPPLGGRESNLFLDNGAGTTAMGDTEAACVSPDFFDARSRVVGVDFATGRVVCADDTMFGPSGPLCKVLYESPAHGTYTVTINGPTPCTEYTQMQMRGLDSDVSLKIELSPGYRPNGANRFVILVAEHIERRFANAPREIDGDFGHFDVDYFKNRIELSGYRPPPRHAH